MFNTNYLALKIYRLSFLKKSLLAFFVSWLVFAQACMQFRLSDSKAKSTFLKKGIDLKISVLKVNDYNLHYVKTGNDSLPTLFFIHGSPGSWDAFKNYLMDSSLLTHFRMISIDRPGFGFSNFGTALHLQEQSDLIYEILKKENNKKQVHLIGQSIGGPVIINIGQDHPESISSLTIISGSISPKDEPKEFWRYLFVYSPLKYLLPGAFRPSNTEIVYFKKDLYQLDLHYDKLTMPVTFIHGDADKFVTVKNVAYGKTKLVFNPKVNYIIIPGAGHFLLWEKYNTIQQNLLLLRSAAN